MRAYIEFAIKRFQNKMAYRLEFFMGILNTILTIIIFCSIYKALYFGIDEVDGITFTMVVTNFVISLGLSGAFSYDEMFLQYKIHDGSITNELLKPVSLRGRILAENIGEGIFKLIFNFIPALIFSIFYVEMENPSSPLNLALMILSVILGYLILWQINFIVQTWAFWIFSVWGIMVIKNVFVNILAGTMLPIWFLPDILKKIVAFTPFQSIYFTPVKIYLGELGFEEILTNLGIQVFWIITLYAVGTIFWKNGIKRLVVQGG